MWDSSSFLGALTPKFYVALTGTSSLISGLILMFEWWYYRKYGTSFIEQVSGGARGQRDERVWAVGRNPWALLRGAEYGRLWSVARRAPLTYRDMDLSAQDHRDWFGGTPEGPAEEAMSRAWRERDTGARVALARAALAQRADCVGALLLLAEEDAPTVHCAWRLLRRAARVAPPAPHALLHAHVRRRAAVCARRLGRLRDAARQFRELLRDAPPALLALAPHENLLEVLLEQRAFAEAAALVQRHAAAPSAALLYTHALLRARLPAAQPAAQPDPAVLEAMKRAIEYNPYVPEYLLELRALTLPPEHVVRRGDSEALAYAFVHLRHWRACPAALRALHALHAAGAPPPPAEGADAELLPAHHAAGGRRAPLLLPLAAALCALAALLALLAHRWPAQAHSLATHAAAHLDPRRLHRLFTAL